MNVTDQNDDVIELAEEHLGRDLMELVLQEIKAAPDVWQKMPEAVQGDVIDRVQRRIESAVKLAVNIIAANGMTRVVADLEGVAIKDDIKATFKVSRGNSADALQALYDAHNKACLLIVATPEQFTGGMDGIEPDPDQPALAFDDAYSDDLYADARKHVIESNRASISSVQRALRIGYNRAARLIERMETEGVVSPIDATGGRTVLIGKEAA